MESIEINGRIPKGVQTAPIGDSNNSVDGKGLILRSSMSPNPTFKKLVIGTPGYDKKYSKDELYRFAKEASEQLPENFHKEWVNSTPGVNFRAQGHKDAVQYAANTMNQAHSCPRLVMYADGSTRDNHLGSPQLKVSGFGVTYKLFNINLGDAPSNEWTDASYGVHGLTEIGAIEALAIHRALCIARYLMERWITQPRGDHKFTPRVIIMSDCLGAINCMYSCYHYGSLGPGERYSTKHRYKELPDEFFDKAYQPVSRLASLGINVEVNWIPGHSGLEGNIRADNLAILGASYISSSLRVDPSAREGVIPVQIQQPGKERKTISQFHLGNAATDLFYWQKPGIGVMLKDMFETDLNRPHKRPSKRKRKESMAEVDDSNIMPPPTKKPKLDTENSTEKQIITHHSSGTAVKGLICWKD